MDNPVENPQKIHGVSKRNRNRNRNRNHNHNRNKTNTPQLRCDMCLPAGNKEGCMFAFDIKIIRYAALLIAGGGFILHKSCKPGRG